MKKRFGAFARSLVLLAFVVFGAGVANPSEGEAFPPPPPLDKEARAWVAKLEKAFHRLEDEKPSFVVVTSEGETVIDNEENAVFMSRGDTAAVVFALGPRIQTSDLYALLLARADALRAGQGPLYSPFQSSSHMAISILSQAPDPESIPVLQSLLDVERLSGMAAAALVNIAETRPDLKPQIEAIAFPPKVLQSLDFYLDREAPAWVTERPQGFDASPLPPLPASAISGQSDYPARGVELEELAGNSLASWGIVRVTGSKGQETQAKVGFDAARVFGPKVKIGDVHRVLQARAEANKTGQEPLAQQEEGKLAEWALFLAMLAQDPTSPAFIAPLLEDKNAETARWAAMALFRIGDASDELRGIVEQIEFPYWVDTANNWGTDVHLPAWVKMNRRPSYLEQADHLQNRAQMANRGQLGCGAGSYVVVASWGEKRVESGLDPIKVFGDKIHADQLCELLKARHEANMTGKGPMSGEKGDLCYVALSVLAKADDPKTVPCIIPLLDDEDDTISGWAVIALLELGQASDELRRLIEPIEFPYGAVGSASSRGVETLSWVKTQSQPRPLEERTDELEELAGRVHQGEFGNQAGAYTLLYGHNERKKVMGDLGPTHVFGKKIVTHSIERLIEDRFMANHSGKGYMRGDKTDLMVMVLRLIVTPDYPTDNWGQLYRDIYELTLNESEDAIRLAALQALIRMGEVESYVPTALADEKFPPDLLKKAQAEGIDLPDWLAKKLPAAKAQDTSLLDAAFSSGRPQSTQTAPAPATSAEPKQELPTAILERAQELQDAAVRYNKGARRGGYKTYYVTTSKEMKVITAGFGLNQVFGEEIKTADLHALLNARAQAIQTDKGPMAGQRRELTCLALAALAEADDPASVTFIKPLLHDEDEFISGWAAIALLELANANEELLALVQPIEFPEEAVKKALQPYEQAPEWMNVKETESSEAD
jgi:HEAT repeat protein